MRMTQRVARIKDERGAAAALVVLSLAALLGMLVLVVDLGGMLTLRRRMVGGADAAALASAQSCARQMASEAQQKATAIAIANQSNIVQTAFSTQGCGTQSSGTVHVGYKAPIDLTFAPVLGFPNSTTVKAEATAEWGPAGGIGVLPIIISLDEQRRIPCVWKAVGTDCNYWWDNSGNGFHSMSNWGFGNLDLWDVDADEQCSDAGTNQRRDWILQGGPPVDINTRGNSLVCSDSGHSTSSWFSALTDLIGTIAYFPVNDPDLMVTSSGNEKYAIIGFTALKIENVLHGDDPAAVGIQGASGSCDVTINTTKGQAIDLDMISGQGCPGGIPVDTISGLTLSKDRGNNTSIFKEGAEYLYDPFTHVVTWKVGGQDNVRIQYDWAQNGTPGACGIRRSDPNAVCLVASWQGAKVGGTRPGGGQDFGVRAIKLSE